MSSIIFTLCSNNYLAHAKTLGDSVKKHIPNAQFIIGLVDKKHPDIDYEFFNSFQILPFDEIGCPFFPEMISIYNVIEFNTAVKPFYFEYLFQKYGPNCLVYYIDPDIVFYSGISELNTILRDQNIIVTPHITTPQLSVSPYETMVLNVGIYNLGFIGIRHTDHSITFLKWWQERLKSLCYIDYAKGLFVDQIWINLVPLLFKGVYSIALPNYNMACWNFHERKILKSDNTYYVNDFNTPLIFFHFSGFKPKDMRYLGKIKIKEFTLEERPDVKDIFHDYANRLMENNYLKLSALKPLLKFGAGKHNRKQKIGLSLKFRTNSLIKKYFGV